MRVREVLQPVRIRRGGLGAGDPEEVEAGRLLRHGDETDVEDRRTRRFDRAAVPQLPRATLGAPRGVHHDPEREPRASVEPEHHGVAVEERSPGPAHPQEREHRRRPFERQTHADRIPASDPVLAEHLETGRGSEGGEREDEICRQRGGRGELGQVGHRRSRPRADVRGKVPGTSRGSRRERGGDVLDEPEVGRRPGGGRVDRAVLDLQTEALRGAERHQSMSSTRSGTSGIETELVDHVAPLEGLERRRDGADVAHDGRRRDRSVRSGSATGRRPARCRGPSRRSRRRPRAARAHGRRWRARVVTAIRPSIARGRGTGRVRSRATAAMIGSTRSGTGSAARIRTPLRIRADVRRTLGTAHTPSACSTAASAWRTDTRSPSIRVDRTSWAASQFTSPPPRPRSRGRAPAGPGTSGSSPFPPRRPRTSAVSWYERPNTSTRRNASRCSVETGSEGRVELGASRGIGDAPRDGPGPPTAHRTVAGRGGRPSRSSARC